MWISVLGSLEAYTADEPVRLGGVKQRTVLARLVAGGGQRVSTEALIDAVYGDDVPDGARRSVQTYVSNLRSSFGDVLVGHTDGYVLGSRPDLVDAARFEQLVADAASLRDENLRGMADTLQTALGLWRGHPYADIPEADAIDLERTRLSRLRTVAIEMRIDADLALGRHDELVSELDALVIEHPHHEGLRAKHIVALYRSGRHIDALRSCEDLRHHLSESGVEPSPQIRLLEQQVLEHDRLLDPPLASVIRRGLLAVELERDALISLVSGQERIDRLVAADQALESAIATHGGTVFAQRLDTSFAAFPDLGSAVAAAAEVVAATPAPPLARVGVDIGEVEATADGSLIGPAVTRVTGLMAMAHPGQVLMSHDARSEAATLPGITLRGLGSHAIPRMADSELVFQLIVEGLVDDFPEVRTDRNSVAPGGMRIVPGYELREELDRGDGWVVWRAYQPSVGREVVIRTVAAHLANEPHFIRRFELEALTVARLEHPHIVPLYDYWRDPSGAFLVSRWVNGRTLEARLTEGSLDRGDITDLIEQIGSALEAAHRAGVVHGGVAAAKVIVDPTGGYSIVDFGIAQDSAARQNHGVHTDIGAFRSLVDTAAGDDEAVDLWMADTETSGAVADLRNRWAEIIESVQAPVAYTPTRNPYRGLDAFSFADARDFHGRDAAIGQLVRTVAQRRLVAVVGPSGVGKSSVVNAGLLPALLAGAGPGSADWLIARVTPGTHPFDALSHAIDRIATTPSLIAAGAVADPGRLTHLAQRSLPGTADVLLVVDQLEELFTLTSDPEVRRSFLHGLAAFATDPESRFRVVVTIRADYFDHPLGHPEFGQLLRSGTVPLSAPTARELVEIVERPAAALGVAFEPGLVDTIIQAVGGEPGRLPLLEYALAEVFSARTSDVVSHAAYESIGGVRGALGRKAEEVFGSLDARSTEAARHVFLRLVTVDDGGRPLRRRVRRLELDRLGVDSGSVDAVVDAFSTHRLLTLDRDPVTRGPTVEVAHEALFVEWDRLAAWIATWSIDLGRRRRLVAAANEWDEAGRPTALLPTGGNLEVTTRWAGDTDLRLSAVERDYLDEGGRNDLAAGTARRRRRRMVLSGFAMAAILAMVLAVVATAQRRSAETARTLAATREVSLLATAQVDIDPERAVLLAIEAIETSREIGPDLPEAVSALRRALADHRIVDRFDGGRLAALSPDGALAMSGTGAGDVLVREVATGETIAELTRSGATAIGAEFSPDGRRIAIAYAQSGDAPVWVWDLDDLSHVPLRGVDTSIDVDGQAALDFDDSGEHVLARFGPDGTVWDTRTGSVTQALPPTHTAVFLPGDGGVLLADPDSPDLSVFDLTTGGVVKWIEAPFPVSELAVSPDGSAVAALGVLDALAAVIDLDEGDARWARDVDRPQGVAWIGDGASLVVGGDAGEPTVFDATDGNVITQLLGHNGSVYSVGGSVGSELVVTSGWADGTTLVWDATPGPVGEVRRMRVNDGPVRHFSYAGSADRLFISDARDDSARIVDMGDGGTVFEIADPLVQLGLEVSAVGNWLLHNATDGTSKLIDISSGDTVYTPPEGFFVRHVTPDGSRVYITQEWHADSTAPEGRIVDVATGDEVSLGDIGLQIFGLLSPDGALLWSWDEYDDTTVSIWDTTTGALVARLADTMAVHPMPDGVTMSVLATDGVLRHVDTAAVLGGAPPAEASDWAVEVTDGFVTAHAYESTPTGSRILTGARGEPVRVWDVADGALVAELNPDHATASPEAEFDPTDEDLVTVLGDDGVVYTYTLDVDELLAIAHSRLTRQLTDEECRSFLHRDSGCAH